MSASQKAIDVMELGRVLSDHGVDRETEPIVSQLLHDLGEILYFRDDPELSDTVLLDPQWVTQIISRVLESSEVEANNAIFTRNHMNELWKDLKGYLRDRMLRLMERFDLSYRTMGDVDRSLVVEKLSRDEADYHTVWDQTVAQPDCREITMRFKLDSTLPPGIPTWFIARQHRFTTNTHWRYGALMADEGRRHHGLIQAFPTATPPSVRLTARGPIPQNFFSTLRDALEFTMGRYPGLIYTRLIPCPNQASKGCPHEFDLADIERRLSKTSKKKTIECPKCQEDFEARSLLDGIWVESAERRLEQVIYNVTVQGDRNVIVGGNVAGQIHTGDIAAELNELTELVQREFTKVSNALQGMPDVACPNVFVLRGSTRESDLTGLFTPIHSPGMFEKVRESLWKQRMELQLYCQAPGLWHPLGYERGKDDPATGLYQIEVSSEFLQVVGPYVVRIAKVMKYARPFIPEFLTAIDPEKYEKQFKDDIEMMGKLSENYDASAFEDRERMLGARADARDPFQADGAALRQLRSVLETKDKTQWGGLKRVMTKEGHWLWLCPEHANKLRE